MKHCPVCKSDSIERTSSTGLRVIGCIILLFIPYGFFICWVPFVFPHHFCCNVCGYSGNEDELLSIDWREKELIVKEIEALGEKLTPIMNKWYFRNEHLYKVVGDKAQILLLEFKEDRVKPYVIVDYIVETIPPKLYVKDQLQHEYLGNRPYVGRFITHHEHTNYKASSSKEDFINWLNENNQLIVPVEIKQV